MVFAIQFTIAKGYNDELMFGVEWVEGIDKSLEMLWVLMLENNIKPL